MLVSVFMLTFTSNYVNNRHGIMKKLLATICMIAMTAAGMAQSEVYFTKEITPKALVKIYKAVGHEASGRVAVKISTGEDGGNNYLKPTLIRKLVEEVNGTIVECCTAYPGKRLTPEDHWNTIHKHGFDSIAAVDIMDEYGIIRIPVKDKKHLKYDIVGSHLPNYHRCGIDGRQDLHPYGWQSDRAHAAVPKPAGAGSLP